LLPYIVTLQSDVRLVNLQEENIIRALIRNILHRHYVKKILQLPYNYIMNTYKLQYTRLNIPQNKDKLRSKLQLPSQHTQPTTLPPRNKKKVFIISNIQSGGSKKYLYEITKHYKNVEFIYIIHKAQLYDITKCMPHDILFVQQLLFTDILPNDVLCVKRKFDLKMFVCIHDFYWFNIKYSRTDGSTVFQNEYLNDNVCIPKDVQLLFENSNQVIHPSQFTINNYNKYFPTHNVIFVPHNDYLANRIHKRVPKIKDNTIYIGNFQQYSECKGSENVMKLCSKYTNYKGYNVVFKIVEKNIPPYTETNWYNAIIFHQFHCLLHLNKFGETYSYTLTKSLVSGLPILYNNIGAFTYRIPRAEHYIKVMDDEKDYENEELLYNAFEKMLDYIIINNGLFNRVNPNYTYAYNPFYDALFDEGVK